MGITQLSFVLLPLSLLWAMRPVRLLQLMVVATVFDASAVLTIGSLGVTPGLAPGGIFLGFVALQILLGVRYPGGRQVWPMIFPFALVTVWAVLSSIIMPRVFEGQIYVWPQKMEPPFVITALAPTAGNLNQDIYLVIDCSLLVLTSMFLTKPSVQLKSLINVYLFSAYLAAAIALWQLGNKLAGIPYPNDLFYSNPGWAILTQQQVGVVPRINGSFSEPSSLAGYMAGIVCSCGWALLQGHRHTGLRLILIVGLVTMALSTSTTGFGVLAIVSCGIPIYAVARGDARLTGSVLNIGLPLVLVGGMIVFAASVIQPTIISNLQEVVDATLSKQESTSYQERTSADADSMTAFEDSFGLGTGWGSNRSSSLIPGLLATVGLPGVGGLIWFFVVLTKHVRRARRSMPSQDHLFVIDASCGALVGYVLPAILAGPTIGSVTFFFLLGLLVACVARVEMDRLRKLPGRRTTR
jgi:hypothetical protein